MTEVSKKLMNASNAELVLILCFTQHRAQESCMVYIRTIREFNKSDVKETKT
jgi:hypothetical protein